MTINDIKDLIFDKIYIYSSSTYETLWTGNSNNIPTKYINAEIRVIGAKRKGILDIGIKQ